MSERRVIYFLLCCGCVTISFNVAAIAAAIPAMSLDLAAPAIRMARIIPSYMIPYGLGALMYAPLTRRISYRTLLCFSMAGYALASLFCASAYNLEHLLLGRVGMGVAGASAIPLGLLVIGQLFERQVRGRLVGLFFSCSFFASIAGIFCSGTLPWRWLFYVPALLGGMTALGLLVLRTDLLNRVHGVRVNYLTSFRVARIRRIFLFIFLISFLYHGVHKWFGVYLDRVYGLDRRMISVFFLIMAVAGAGGQLLGGVVSDKRGRRAACLGGIVLLAAATMLLAGHYPLGVLAVILGGVSMGWTIGHNGVSTVLTDFPSDHRPQMASLNSAVRFVGGGIGFYLSSFFVEQSFGGTFFAIGVLLLLLAGFLPRMLAE